MNRRHLHLPIEDLEKGMAFHSTLFAAAPARDSSAISPRSARPGIDHLGLPTDGLRRQSREESIGPDAPELHFVFAVGAHPAVEGDAAARKNAFLLTLVATKRRIELMLSLPLASLDRLVLQNQVTDSGRR